jgi:hypothetical protein
MTIATSPSGYLKQFVDRETSNWVMVVLERAGVARSAAPGQSTSGTRILSRTERAI